MSGRLCSLVCAVFNIARERVSLEEAPDRAVAGRMPAFDERRRSSLMVMSGVSSGSDRVGPACASMRPERRGIAVALASRHRLQNPNAKIKAKNSRHICQPPVPADSVNHNSSRLGIPNRSHPLGSCSRVILL